MGWAGKGGKGSATKGAKGAHSGAGGKGSKGTPPNAPSYSLMHGPAGGMGFQEALAVSMAPFVAQTMGMGAYGAGQCGGAMHHPSLAHGGGGAAKGGAGGGTPKPFSCQHGDCATALDGTTMGTKEECCRGCNRSRKNAMTAPLTTRAERAYVAALQRMAGPAFLRPDAEFKKRL